MVKIESLSKGTITNALRNTVLFPILDLDLLPFLTKSILSVRWSSSTQCPIKNSKKIRKMSNSIAILVVKTILCWKWPFEIFEFPLVGHGFLPPKMENLSFHRMYPISKLFRLISIYNLLFYFKNVFVKTMFRVDNGTL